MTLWNTKGDSKPKYVSKEDRKKVVATKEGWVRRESYVDGSGNQRTKDEILIAISNLSGLATMGNPDVTDVYVANSTGGSTLKANLVGKVYVVYSEPISIGTSPSALTLTVSNAANASTFTATSNTNKASIKNANNTLEFNFTPTVAGTYKVSAQTMSGMGSAKVYSISGGASETANAVISNTVSTSLGNFLVS